MPVGELDFGFGAQQSLIGLQMDLGRMQLRWFDHWLKGVDTGMLAEAPIRLFVMGTNVWRDEQEWPLARTAYVPYYLASGGGLHPGTPAGDGGSSSYVYDPADPVPTHGGAVLLPPEFIPGPLEQSRIEARPDVLTFTTEPLEHDVEVTGPVTVELWACTSAPDTDFVARLVDVWPDGRAFNLTDGILRGRFRSGVSSPMLLTPGEPYQFRIDLWATANVFRAGHRIRLQVTSSNFPRWDRNPNTGHALGVDSDGNMVVAHQTVLHDAGHPSHVVLPIIP
jgi:putative CocE/NonD family hydrolase